MKKIICISVMSLLSMVSFSQNIPFKIQKSEIFEDQFKESQIVLSEEDGTGGILIVRSYKSSGISPNSGYFFEHYDANLKLINEYDFQLKHPVSQKTPVVLGVFELDNKITIIELFYDIIEKSYICLANSVNPIDFVVQKKELFRLSRDEVKKYGNFSLSETFFQNANMKSLINGNFSSQTKENLFSFDFSLSNKSEKKSSVDGGSNIALVINNQKNRFSIALNFKKPDSSDMLKIYCFDNQFNKIIDRDLSIGDDNRKYFLQNIELSEDGSSIYLLNKSFSKKLMEKDNGGKYQFEIRKIGQNKVESQIFETQEHYIGNLKSIIYKGKLVYIGFYSDIKDNRYKGVAYYELDPENLEVKKSKFNSFTEEFIIDKYGKIDSKELKFLTFKNLLITEKNHLIFNAEESFITSSGGANGFYGNSNSRVFYNYYDIVSLKIDEEGNLLWARNINKKQSGDEVDSFVSYTSTLLNDNVYFFINANEKIKNIDTNRIEFRDTRKNKYNLNLIRINEKGDFEYQEILDDEVNEVPFMVANGIKFENSVFFLGRKGSKKQLLKISL